MAIQRIITRDFKQAERCAKTGPKSTSKDIAETNAVAAKNEKSYGYQVALARAGWLDTPTT